MEIQIAVAKVNRFGVVESGDTLEVVERPNGGMSVVLSDARSSGHEAKFVSTTIVRKVIGLLADGVRDGAAARAASDALYTEYAGQITAYLNILSVDLQTNTLVITRNNPTPIFLSRGQQVECLPGESQPIGLDRNVRPLISELHLQPDMVVVMYTDGVTNAGSQFGQEFDICLLLNELVDEEKPAVNLLADRLLNQAIRLDNFAPHDDMSVVVLRVVESDPGAIRRMYVSLPVSEARAQDDEGG